MRRGRREQAIGVSDLPLWGGDDYARACRVADYDICERRSGDQGGSHAANDRAAASKQELRTAVLRAIRAAGARGLTLRELASDWDKPMHAVSGRFSELRDLGLISRRMDPDGRPELREGCGVWVLV